MIKDSNDKTIYSSFRDPSGFLFTENRVIYRQVNKAYKENYDYFIDSGLHKILIDEKLLVPDEETEIAPVKAEKAYKIIKPTPIKFISYPYEWCFSQLKDAALTTLVAQKKALTCGMSLKDASAYNIQFEQGRPILIDTLSFEKHNNEQPWVAYRQFCQHFLAPLALMSYVDARLSQLFRTFIDGIPLDLASKLLPRRAQLKPGLFLHIYLHARTQQHFADKQIEADKLKHKPRHLSTLALIDSLESAIRGLKYKLPRTGWVNYYEDNNYSKKAFDHKKDIINEFLGKVDADIVWDIGANGGLFSRIAGEKGMQVISFDIDTAVVEKNYLESIKKHENNIFPLVLDLFNPSPCIGWENRERMSIMERAPADLVFSLALIHHLAINNNLPLDKIADFFRKICNWLIVEFVPKSDSQVQKLLSIRQDIFCDYTKEAFETEFKKHFTIKNSLQIKDSKRTLYLMEKVKT